MSLITLDFETYYDKQFSLSKLTTEQYIRDPRFEAIGLGYRIDDGPLEWVTGDRLELALHALDLPNHKVLAHNTAFDGAILAWRYGIHPKMLLDTMSMARPLGLNSVSLANLAQKFGLGEKGTEVINALGKHLVDFTPEELDKYGEYCKNDVLLTYNLFHVLQQFSTPQELYIIDMMLRMFTDPVLELDKEHLSGHLDKVRNHKEKLMAKIDASIGRDELMSNQKFAEVLKKLGVSPPTKISPTTQKETFAFGKNDPEFKALLEHPSPLVQAVVSARLGVKSTLEETRTESFIGIAERGELPIMLNYYGAHTGRASGGDKINLQNLPRGGALRYAIKAPADHTVIASDSSQIEARVVAWLAGQDDLVEDFANGADIYSKFASDVYGRPINRKRVEIGPDGKEFHPDKLEGHVGKTCILGLGFGMGKDKFKLSLKTGNPSVEIDIAEAERIVQLYRNKYPKIAALWKEADRALLAMSKGQTYELGTGILLHCNSDGIHLPNGMLIRYTNLRKEADGFVYDTKYGPNHIYGAKVVENVVQALARIVVFNQMGKIDQQLRKYDRVKPGVRFKTALTVHDEVVVVVHKRAEQKVKEMMLKIMSTPPKWAPDLPISCEAAAGPSYGECK